MTTSKKFRFVSPGVYVSEIDKSQLPALPAEIGPVVIGRSQRGPTMMPVTVNSYLEFVDKFGEPTRGVASDDVWRSGLSTSPLYGVYAAKAYLKNSSPLTFVRLAGNQSPNLSSNDELAQAGWKLQNVPTVSTGTNGGAYGLFVVPSGSNLSSVTGTLAAVWYLNSGAIRLVGKKPDDTLSSNGAGELIKSINSNYEYRVEIVDSSGAKKLDTSFNFSEDSSKYIRKVFNTNPTLVNAEITPDESLKNYWLGETFATFLSENVSEASGTMAFIAPLQSLTPAVNLANFSGKQSESAKTGWIISQHLSSVTGSFAADQMTKLFRFVVAETAGGEWEQKNVKISIKDIKPSTNNFNKYGSFTVMVRDIRDTDANPRVLETFTNCNLDPNSSDFIGAKIGDEYLDWDTVNKRYVKYGNYVNKSSYIRVELNPLLEQAGIAEEALPFGMFGPPVYNDLVVVSGSALAASSLIRGTDSMPFAPVTVSGSIDVTGLPTGSSMKIVFPTMKLRISSSQANTLDPSDAFYGAVANRLASTRLDGDYLDLVRGKPFAVDSFLPTTGVTKPSWVFTLDEVVAVPNSNGLSFWQSGSRVAGTSMTAVSASASGSLEGYKAVLAYGADKFTVPLFGGTDALNVKEKDPFRNTLLDDANQESQNAMLYTLNKAIDTVKDPDVIDINMVAIPGITNRTVTKHMIDVAEARADALAIVDIEGGYVPSHESDAEEKDRRGSVSATVSALKDRNLNSSYACTYYPWVKVLDDASGLPLWMPPSVVALGTMASSQETTEVWFAPAGFNRGGLSAGSSGLSVLDVREKLSSKERDRLYESNINPIASFPNEGVVIFGQKTLQVTQSALDRINVRRLMIFLKKEVSRISTRVLFDQNLKVTWDRFKGEVEPFLSSVKSRFGLADYKVILDETTTTPDLVDRNIMYAKIYLKPARAIEFIALDFIITRSGASFDD
jgi:hypothetical protein